MAALRPLLEDDGQPSSGSPLHIGQVVSGKYRIERQIGRGGMGIVLAATHLQLEHLVAIKVLRRDLGMDDKALDRLLMEARSAARIRSEHVARVLDVGTLDNGLPFIVMEYLDGENLADLLDREGALDIDQAAVFLMQCCLALAEVHVAEMVHRDLKPGNLFIARLPDGSPSVKIVDFGISKQIGSAREGAATTSPQVLGSPYYMSPEQMRAEPVDERSDIWGLGAILFEMLTGRPPFIGDTLPEVYAAVLNDPPPPVDSLRSGVPAGLDDVVQRCLEKDPAQRFCDVADLAEALAPYAGSGAAQSVERITRILTNPDAMRGRYSLLPGGAPAASGLGASDQAPLISGIMGTNQHGEGMMAGGARDGDTDGGAKRSSIPDLAGAAPGGTILEANALPRSGEGVRRQSRPPFSADYAALSATGAAAGRTSYFTWRHAAWLLAGLALLAGLGIFSFRAGSPPSPDRARVERPAVTTSPTSIGVTPTPPAGSAATTPPAPPRVTPIVPGEGRLDSTGASSPAARPRGEVFALQPTPRAKPASTGSSANSDRGAGASAAASAAPPRRPEPADDEPAAPRNPAAGRADKAQADDPWNPDSFGDRR